VWLALNVVNDAFVETRDSSEDCFGKGELSEASGQFFNLTYRFSNS
jgi:hypothetical protein